MARRRRSSRLSIVDASAFHLGEATCLGDALRDRAIDVAAVGRVARVLAEARLLRLQLRAAPRRDRPAEQRAAARAQRRRVARRRVRRPRGHQQQDGGGEAQRERRHGGGGRRRGLACGHGRSIKDSKGEWRVMVGRE